MRAAFQVALLCIVLVFTLAAQAQSPATTTGQPTGAAPSQPEAATGDELKALEQDTQRMRTILNQMRENLGFVGNTTMPINHQFALEIDMWQLALDQMDRRIARLRTVPGK